MSEWFTRFAQRASVFAGHYLAFIGAVTITIIWAVTGPFFGFSQTWQLVINTDATIITFLMVFLIQNTQNRDALAVHLKLDELIRAMQDADNALMRAADDTDEGLAELKQKYEALSHKHAEIAARLDHMPIHEHAGMPTVRP